MFNRVAMDWSALGLTVERVPYLAACRFQAGRRGRALDVAGVVRAPVPVRHCHLVRSRCGHLDGRRAHVAGACTALCIARPGGSQDRRRTSCSSRWRRPFAGLWSPVASRTLPGTVTPATRSPTSKQSRLVEIEANAHRRKAVFASGRDRRGNRCASALKQWRSCSSGLSSSPESRGRWASTSFLIWFRSLATSPPPRLAHISSGRRRNLGMSKWQMARMTGNVGLNWLLGLFSVIPIVGVDSDASLPLEQPQPEDYQEASRQSIIPISARSRVRRPAPSLGRRSIRVRLRPRQGSVGRSGRCSGDSGSVAR